MPRAPTTRLLAEVATITAGAPVLSDDSPASDAVPVLQARDLARGALPPTPQLDLARVAETGRRERATVRPGDVVLVARGTGARAAVVGSGTGGAVASANLLLVRLGPELLPSVLVAFLTTREGERRLASVRTESTTPLITVSALGRLEVPVPPMEVQRALSEFVTASSDALAADEDALAVRRELTIRITESVLAGLDLANMAGSELA